MSLNQSTRKEQTNALVNNYTNHNRSHLPDRRGGAGAMTPKEDEVVTELRRIRKSLENCCVWRQEVPDCTGYWLRIDSIGRLRTHFVSETLEGLVINWGFNEEGGILSLAHPKLLGFWWMKLAYPRDVETNLRGVQVL